MSKRKDRYKKYLQSEEWLKTRCDAIEYAGHKCERCGRSKSLQVHHLNYDNLGCEEPGDLIVLCGKHHLLEHGLIKNTKSKPRNINTDTIPYLRKKLMRKFSIKLKGGRGWIGLAKKTAILHGEVFTGKKASAKTYVKKKLNGVQEPTRAKPKTQKRPKPKGKCPDCGKDLFFAKTVIACVCGYRKEVNTHKAGGYNG